MLQSYSQVFKLVIFDDCPCLTRNRTTLSNLLQFRGENHNSLLDSVYMHLWQNRCDKRNSTFAGGISLPHQGQCSLEQQMRIVEHRNMASKAAMTSSTPQQNPKKMYVMGPE